HKPSQLSGGQQQRVSIARALINGGQVILADEPTGALDTQSGQEVMSLLEELAHKGHTVILITHDPKVAKHADRVIEVIDGKVVNDTGWKANKKNKTDNTTDKTTNDPLAVDDQFLEEKGARVSSLEEAIRMALRSLRANLFRTVLTLLGIVIGFASVVAMLAIGEGAEQSIVDRISAMGTNMLTIHPRRGSPGQRGGAAVSLTFEDVDAINKNVSNIAGTLPEIQGGYTIRLGSMDYQTTVTATTYNLPETRSWPLASGVFFTHQDSEQYTPVAVLGKTVVDNIFTDGSNPLGQYILIKNVPFQVIGILTSKGSSGFGGRDQDDAVFVPLKTGGLRLFGQTHLRSLTVAVDNGDLINQTEQELTAFLTQRHGAEDFRIFNSAELLSMVSESQATFTLLLGSVAAISLLVGGIGVMNIMLVSVTERTREIGIRMATGARQSDILQQFLAEAIVVSGLGGIIGIGLGIGVGSLIELLGAKVVFSVGPMLMAFSCATATGLIFGFAPARKAAQLDPVVALAND
ncbi:MAG: ABC transporter permease, partial [Spongiibacteraceae bacterium]|nr:ABC transporter permease [Spongiibacteraceae bacterium]